MKLSSFTTRGSLCACLLACLTAAPITGLAYTNSFTSDADYDTNFVELNTSGTASLALETYDTTERGIRKTGSGSQSIIFDTSASGGSGGNGSSSGSQADANFSDVTIGADLRFMNLNAPSVGFWAQVPADCLSGYLGDFTIISSTSVRLRVYDSNSNPSTSGVGTNLLNQTITIPSGQSLNTSSFYRGRLIAKPTTGGDMQLTLEFSAADGTLLASASVTDTGSPLIAPGQVGIRFASQSLRLDNFTIIPASSGEIINIKDAPYSAKGDGSTNDRAAFAAAFAALNPGDTLYVPDGIYRIILTGSTLVQPAGTTILGQRGGAMLKLENGGSSSPRQFLKPGGDNVIIDGITIERAANFELVVFQLYDSSNPDGITIRNCTIIGNRNIYSSVCHGFKAGDNSVSNILLENLYVTTCTYGLLIDSSATGSVDEITVHNSQFYRNYATDLEFNAPNSYAANITVTDCHFRENQGTAASAGWAVGLAEVHTATILDCFISDYGRAGIHVEDHSEDVLISGNHFINTATIGDNPVFVISSSNNVSIDRNVIDARDNTRSGMHLVLVTAGGGGHSVPTNVSVTGNILVNGPATTTWYLQPGSGPAPTGNIIAP